MKNLFILVAMLNVSSINISAEEELLFNLKDNKILPANEAFELETIVVQDALQIKWIIKDGYYLYFDSILVKANNQLIKYNNLSFVDSVSMNVNSNFTFENFVVGHSNQMPFAASKKICEKNSLIYNPLKMR